MDLTKVLIILIAFLIIITLYVIIKLNRFMRTILNEEKDGSENMSPVSEQRIADKRAHEKEVIVGKNNDNIKKLQEINSDISLDEAKQFAQTTLLSIFSTIEDYNFKNMNPYSELIYLKLNNIITKQKELQQIEFFQDVNINSLYLTSVEESPGYTSLVFEINISMKHHIQNNTEIIFGNPNEIISDRYIISIAYIDSVSELDYETKRTNIHGIKCPNCGESIRELKDIKCMVCEYDNTDLIENRFIAIDYSRG